MQFHILTLFPEILKPYFDASLLGRAQKEKILEIFCHPLRDYATHKHRSVDDHPYGGGAGMVFRPDVVVSAVRDLKSKYPIEKVILLSPRGPVLSHKKALELASAKSILLICGRYEGVDERAIDLVVDEELSIGDYVITGGELASQIVVDAVSRFVPGVVGDEESPKNDSHSNGLIEHPQYTRPEVFEGKKVPGTLLSGNHAEIEKWRHEESLKQTKAKRPDLLGVGEHKVRPYGNLYLALLHYPVVNKHGELVTTSITNFDLHDLARTCTTYGLSRFFIVTPNESQQNMARFIQKYWREGFGAGFNPDRRQAFAAMEVVSDLSETCLTIEKIHGTSPRLIATTANPHEKAIRFKNLKRELAGSNKPVLILFGTGWGLAPSVFEKVDGVLEPISGPSSYNHLPVRGAVAIILDRLLGVDYECH